MRRISSKPLDKQTDQQLVNSFWAIFSDCCKRYGVTSFDMPTLGVIFPVEKAKLDAIKAEGRERIRARGVFNGVPHDKVSCRPLAA